MTKSKINPEMLAATAVALSDERYLTHLAEAWLADEGDSAQNRAEVEERMVFIRQHPLLVRYVLHEDIAHLSLIERLRFAVACWRESRRAARLA